MSPRWGFGRGCLPRNHGLTPMATTYRPVGTKHISSWRNRIAPRHHRIQPRHHRIQPRRNRIAPRHHRIAPRHHRIQSRHHRISSRRHRISPQRGDIAFSRNAATGCSHGRKPMDRGPPIAQSPKGTAGTMIHVAPSGLRTVRSPRNHWLTPHGYHLPPLSWLQS